METWRHWAGTSNIFQWLRNWKKICFETRFLLKCMDRTWSRLHKKADSMAAPVVRVYPELMKSGSNDCPVHDRSKNRRAFHRVVHRATASTLRNSWVDSWDMSGKCDTICWIYSVISSLGSSVNDTWRTGSLPVISCLSSFFSLFFDSAACQALSSLPSRGLLLIEIWSSYIRMTVHVSVYCMCAWACVSTEVPQQEGSDQGSQT